MYQIDLKKMIEENNTAKKKKNICNSLEIGEKALVLDERLKKDQHLKNYLSR